MIRMAHARTLQCADHWARRRRRQLDANPVPLLVVNVTAPHRDLKHRLQHAGIHDAFYMDASTGARVTALADDNVLYLGRHSSLHEARPFLERAHRARRCLDVLLIEDVARPDLAWCSDLVDAFDVLA